MTLDAALADARARFHALDSLMRAAVGDGKPFARWRELNWRRRVMRRLERMRVEIIVDGRLN